MEESEDEKELEKAKAAGANEQGLKRSSSNSPVSVSLM